MKITIDTKEDSHDEIKKVIKMLSSLVGEKEVFTNQPDMFNDETNESSKVGSSEQGSVLGNLFDNGETSLDSDESKEEEIEEEKTEEEEKDESPQIMPYDF